MVKKKIIFDPDLDERLKDGYYFMMAYCKNCDHPEADYKEDMDVMIPTGMEKPKRKFKCPNCKCKTLYIL